MGTMQSARETAEVLRGLLRAHGAEDALAWLERGWPAAGAPFQRGLFFGFYAGAGRRFGHSHPPLTEDQRRALTEAGVACPGAFSLSDLARAGLLLAAAAELDLDAQPGLAQEAFRKGDSAERVALLKTLSLLPQPARFAELAADACRSHVDDVFEGIACDNPFPARHMSEPAFNQLVMKALFVGVPLARVVGWEGRNNSELRRMVGDYAAERRAAGRVVPADVALVEAPLEDSR